MENRKNRDNGCLQLPKGVCREGGETVHLGAQRKGGW